MSFTIHSLQTNPQLIFDEINAESSYQREFSSKKNIQLQPALSKQEYIEAVQKLQQHILRGDCYEINFCQEFFAENILIEPVAVYQQLLEISPVPFSCFYKTGK